MRWPLTTPVPPEWSVRDALGAYLEENGFTLTAYDAPTATVTVLGFDFEIPNTDNRKSLVRRHDLHHIATGYGTSFAGEAEVAAWEMSRGLKGCGLYVRAIITVAFIGGLLFAPARTWRAFRAAPGGSSLFPEPDYERLISLNVGALRVRLELPAEGLAHLPRKLHVRAPSVNSSAQCLEE